MTWLKLTSEALYLMKGGTNSFVDKVDLESIVDKENEFKLAVPAEWLQGSDAPSVVVVDVGSTEQVQQSKNMFKSDSIFDKVIERAVWGAMPPTSRFEVVAHPRYIVIHHTEGSPTSGGVERAKDMLKGIQRFHMESNGWSDIGYNFVNSVDGILLEGRANSLAEASRGNDVRGAHAGTDEGNRSPGVANEGNFMTVPMNDTQWNSLVDMCAALCQACDIDPANIKGHRDFVATSCPGDVLYSRLPQLRKEVAARLNS